MCVKYVRVEKLDWYIVGVIGKFKSIRWIKYLVDKRRSPNGYVTHRGMTYHSMMGIP